MQNSTTLYKLEKSPLNRMERHYSEHLYTLESNDGKYASVYLDNKQVAKYIGDGAWANAQRYASMLALNLDMGDL
jgi:hypothetical protein